jgi:hypothetical protein
MGGVGVINYTILGATLSEIGPTVTLAGPLCNRYGFLAPPAPLNAPRGCQRLFLMPRGGRTWKKSMNKVTKRW